MTSLPDIFKILTSLVYHLAEWMVRVPQGFVGHGYIRYELSSSGSFPDYLCGRQILL
jgi:hypothetical protein